VALLTKERNVLVGLFLIGCLWFVAVGYSASVTKNAFVFGDEAGYFLPIIFGSSPNNYQHWGDTFAEYPSYLYFWLYSELPRENLHFWVKILNAAFVACTAWPAYLVARRYLAEIPSAIFACFVIATPIASFARYVMPETLYFFGFWCSLAVVLLLVPMIAGPEGGPSSDMQRYEG
jgi:hypothetical protein